MSLTLNMQKVSEEADDWKCSARLSLTGRSDQNQIGVVFITILFFFNEV